MSEDPPVGSVGDEAAKLLGALADHTRDWARDWGGEAPAGWVRQLDEHLATGAPECQLCPVCRTVHLVREAGPEVRSHLAAAAASLMQAAVGLLEASSGGGQRDRPGPTSVQRIDLDDDGADPTVTEDLQP